MKQSRKFITLALTAIFILLLSTQCTTRKRTMGCGGGCQAKTTPDIYRN